MVRINCKPVSLVVQEGKNYRIFSKLLGRVSYPGVSPLLGGQIAFQFFVFY